MFFLIFKSNGRETMKFCTWNKGRGAAPYVVRSRGSGARLPGFKYWFCHLYFMCPGQVTDKFSLLLSGATKRTYLMGLIRVLHAKCLKQFLTKLCVYY